MGNPDNRVAVDLALGPTGVYLLSLKGVVVYVGQSLNVFGRISEHCRTLQRGKRRVLYGVGIIGELIIFDKVEFVLCDKRDLDAEEFALIQQYRPKHNTLLNRPISPVEEKIKNLPCIQDLVRKATEREQVGKIRRRRLPSSILEVERNFQRDRDQRIAVTLPKLRCLEDDHAD